MGEYASLTVWKNIEKESGSIFSRFCKLQEQGIPDNDIYSQLRIDYWGFGHIHTAKFNEKTHYSYSPMDFVKRELYMQECKYNLPLEWLLCFRFPEFKVEGDNQFGKFTAQTTVGKALQGLREIDFQTQSDKVHHLKENIENLIRFLEFHNEDDILIASSDMIYYSPDGEFGIDYVKNEINEKVKTTREMVAAPHWRKVRTA